MAGNNKALVKGAPPLTAYLAMNELASIVFAEMSFNISNFPVPIPALSTLGTANTTLEGAISTWGPVGNRGSHNDLLNLRAASLAVQSILRQLAAYVQNLVPTASDYATQAAFITSSGFSVKATPSVQGVLAAPTNLHQVFALNVPINKVKLRWKKPIGLNSKGNVKSYQVWRAVQTDPSAFSLVATTTKTSFVDLTTAASISYEYYVVGINNQGQGAISSVISVVTPAAI